MRIFVSKFAGGGLFMSVAGRFICLRKVAGSGIPGVGVSPGLTGLLRVLGSGIPGVGVAPLGTLFTSLGAGIPGVVLVEGGAGLAEKPGGRSCGAIIIVAFVF